MSETPVAVSLLPLLLCPISKRWKTTQNSVAVAMTSDPTAPTAATANEVKASAPVLTPPPEFKLPASNSATAGAASRNGKETVVGSWQWTQELRSSKQADATWTYFDAKESAEIEAAFLNKVTDIGCL